MSEKELRRAGVLARVKAGELKLRSAAEILAIGHRQAKRLWKRYRRSGAKGLVHGNANRRSNQAKPVEFRARVLRLVRNKYSGEGDERFGPTLAAEHLESDDGLKVSAETLRLWMLEEGLWSRARVRRPYRSRRERKKHFGELVQLDGSFHNWLEGRGPQLCLVNMVDDATGTTLAQFHGQETIWAAVDVYRAWVEQYGVPRALYTDWKNVYVRKPTEEERLREEAPLTQFGRMCARLGTKIIAASSPQAKGRVERNHGTHQDRLIKKLRLKAVSTAEAANDFLQRCYLPDHNRRFTVPAADADDYHRRAPNRRELDSVFCLEEQRVISNDWVVRYNNRYLQLQRGSRYAPARQRVTIRQARDGSVKVYYRGREIGWTEIQPRLAAVKARPTHRPVIEIGRGRRAPSSHPWRTSYKTIQPGWAQARAL